MDRAQQLLDKIASWKTENSRHERFARELERLIDRITAGFEGTQLDILLDEAERSFTRQREVHARLNSAAEALEEVMRLQRQLAEQLSAMGSGRRGATLH